MSRSSLKSLATTSAIAVQNRLTKYLKRLREKGCLTQSQMAEKIGIKSTTHYNQKIEHIAERERPPREFNKIVQSCDVLEQFGQLEGMDFSEFACYLKNSRSDATNRSLFPWERDTLGVLNEIDRSITDNFTSLGVSKAKNNRMERFEQALDLVYLLLRMDKGSFRTVAQLVHEIARLNKIPVKPVSKKWVGKL